MYQTPEEFYLDKQEPVQSCLYALRDIILGWNGELRETLKYGMPCFVYRKKQFCYLWTDKKTGEPYLLMVEGNRINHPALVQGDRKRMKILPVDPAKDIPVDTITQILDKALTFYPQS